MTTGTATESRGVSGGTNESSVGDQSSGTVDADSVADPDGSGAPTGGDAGTAPGEGPDEPEQDAETDTGADAAAAADDDAADEPSPALSLDVVFEIAKNERRRRVLEYLREREDPADLGELAEHIAALENDKPVRQLTSAERKRVYVGLYQCHLPKMDGADVVNFDRNPGITLGKNADQVMQYLRPPAAPDDRWPAVYLSEALLGIAVVLVGGLLVGGAAATVAAGVLSLAMLVTAVAHARDVTLPAAVRAGTD